MTPAAVLVVTADEVLRRTLTEAFTSGGFEVVHASTAAQVLTLPSAPPLLVVDADLPDLNGFQLCRRLRAYPPAAHALVALVCAESAGAEVRAAAFECGADAVFTEPIDAGLVTANVGALFRVKAAERAACQCKLEEEWKEAEALKAAEQRLGALAAVVEDLFWVNQLEPLRCLYVSPSYEQRWGLSRQALYDDIRTWDRLVHPDDVARVQRAFVAKAATGGFDEEYRIVLPDGRLRWVRERAFPLVDDDGRVRRVAGTTEDVTERRAMHATLEATEIWLELAQRGARAGAWELTVATGEVRWSPACYDMYGVSQDTRLSYATWASTLHPEDRERATRTVARTLETGENLSLQFRIVRPDGDVRWIRGVARVVRDAGGRPARLVGFSLDITEGKRLEGLRDFVVTLQDRLSGLLEAGAIIREASEALGKHLDVSRCLFAEIEQDDDEMTVGPDFHPGVPSFAGTHPCAALGVALSELRAGRTVSVGDTQAEPGAPTTLWHDSPATARVRAFVAVPVMRGQRWTSALVVAQDEPRKWRPRELALIRTIAERVGLAVENARLLEGLRGAISARDAALVRSEHSESRLRRIFDGCPVGIMVATGGRIIEANPAFLALVGYTAEEVARGDLDWRAMTPREYAPLDELALAQLRQCGECEPYEKEYLHKDGSRIPVLIGGGALRVDPLEAVAFVLDVTEQRRARDLTEAARRAADEANAAKDQFLAMLSHELRTPLSAVVGWTRLLRQGDLDGERAARALASIERATQSQIRLINDLLDVSRIVTGKLTLEHDRVDFVQVVDAAVATLKDAVAAKRLHLGLELPREALAFDGDARRLEQVVWNLLGNAVKFTPEGGRVDVRLERRGDVARLSVSDTGIGVSPAFLPHVFDRFWQGGAGGRSASRGLGLGLAIAKHVVEAHGGRIMAESAGEGLGSTFTVELPVVASALRGQVAPARESLSRRLDSARVLVVDDDEETCVLVRTILERHGARVQIVTSASAAREAIDDLLPDIMVCDIEMPGDDGYALIADVRQRTTLSGTQLPALALTAHAGAEDRRRALAAGFQEHLAKPFDPDVLVATLATLAERGRRSVA